MPVFVLSPLSYGPAHVPSNRFTPDCGHVSHMSESVTEVYLNHLATPDPQDPVKTVCLDCFDLPDSEGEFAVADRAAAEFAAANNMTEQEAQETLTNIAVSLSLLRSTMRHQRES